MEKTWIYDYFQVIHLVKPIGETSRETGVSTNKIKSWGDHGLIRMALKNDMRHFFIEDFDCIKCLNEFAGRGTTYDDLRRKMIEKGFTPAYVPNEVNEAETLVDEVEEMTTVNEELLNKRIDDIKHELAQGITESLVKSLETIQTNLLAQITQKDRLLLENSTKIRHLELALQERESEIFKTSSEKLQVEQQLSERTNELHQVRETNIELKAKFDRLEKELSLVKNKGLFNKFKMMFSGKKKKEEV